MTTSKPLRPIWWYAADTDGVTPLDRYSYLTESAARRAHPDAPWIVKPLSSTITDVMARTATAA